jgi:hypothetical protein
LVPASLLCEFFSKLFCPILYLSLIGGVLPAAKPKRRRHATLQSAQFWRRS